MSFFDLPPIIERMLLVSDKISDLNFSVGQLPQVEINGRLTPVQPLGLQKLTPYQTEIIAMTLLHGNPDAAHRLAHTGSTDLSYDFPSALRAALRQAPKVILIGEMRDYETTEIALEAAETGHLVLSTLHTIDASKTIDRIIGLYPKNEEQVIRTRLAQTFRFIVSQRLIPRADGRGRIAAVEILKSTPRTREYIAAGESEGKSLLDAMRDGRHDGMQDFDTVTLEDGMSFATNPNNLQLALKGMSSSDDFTAPDKPTAPAPRRPAATRTFPPAPARPSAPASMLDMIE